MVEDFRSLHLAGTLRTQRSGRSKSALLRPSVRAVGSSVELQVQCSPGLCLIAFYW